MPCNDGGWGRDSGYSESTLNKEKQKIRDELEPLLCSACRELEERGYDFDKNPALAVWWDKHKKADEARRTAEEKAQWERRVISEALKKPFGELTTEEKALLKRYKYI